MGGELSVANDRLSDFEVLHANIFTPGQGICLQRLNPGRSSEFKFDYSLAYGSWYDILIVGHSTSAKAGGEVQRYLTKGVYLSYKKKVKISELTAGKNRDLGAEWNCGACHKDNIGSLRVCEYCFTNRSQKIIIVLSYIPVLGLPFSLTNAVLQCGKAAQSNSIADEVDAGLSVAMCIMDVVTAPFIVGSLVTIPAKVTAETGVKLTAKTVFCDASKPLLVAVGKEFGKGGIVAMSGGDSLVLRKFLLSERRFSSPSKQENNANDFCRDCVDTFDTLIYLILDGIIEVGIINTCDDVCDYVTAKSGSPVLYAICAVDCDALGINEFIKIAKEVDLDPIYFCESLKICPINDNGDAKFKSFSILPSHAPVYSTFVIDFTYESVNGTGSGQLLVNIQTIDYVEILSTFLIESLKPGRYAERITVDASPDPTCDPSIEECEQWYPGVYNVTIMIYNGECGSHHPHSQVYDMVKGSFRID
ncbi:unnamed protein product [Rotaria sp. Silwood1]|nr:unnamed protein product [Rotaria sp. Silwood1]CAF1587159.1 unnamed protein product [Rotaria sp. Silwood1]CAF3803410.1 unnamed protein product [Rotaria sp. Silwood1]CAF4780501.1 unnamed protein product [Rotaria sp. Silwood1]